ncbi:hypothetical protein HPB48_026223 [Haemaphysalis longicornis]|uniref:Bromo domain-containing protein n=1 Tax=Haemaphysalis longicornis TaxID=44386 RepID=A0A9J6H8Z7_HAELO|nr:hypothetical protein HPB48_026223 [Haemaphysalis longicornis]
MALLLKPVPSKMKDDVRKTPDPTTLPRKPVTIFDIATCPRVPTRAESATHTESHRLTENASHVPATQKHMYKQRGKLTEQMKYCNSILMEPLLNKRAWPFRNPTDAGLLGLCDYYEVIKHPMDMGMVKQKVDHRQYHSHEEFAKDMRLVFTKCYRYNPPQREVFVMAQELQTLFELLYAKLPDDPRSKKRKPSPQPQDADSDSSWTSESSSGGSPPGDPEDEEEERHRRVQQLLKRLRVVPHQIGLLVAEPLKKMKGREEKTKRNNVGSAPHACEVEKPKTTRPSASTTIAEVVATRVFEFYFFDKNTSAQYFKIKRL